MLVLFEPVFGSKFEPFGSKVGLVGPVAAAYRRGMAIQTKSGIVRIHSDAVIFDANQLLAAVFRRDQDSSRLRVDRVLDQFLDHRRRAFHDLARGLQVTVVAKSSYGLGSILVRKDSGVGSIKDLKGKKVAGSRKNSGNDVILRGFLLKELGGLDPEADVQMVYMGEEAKGSAVESRQVDGAMTVEPFTTQHLLAGQTKVVYGSRFLHGTQGAPFISVAANRFLTGLTNVLYGASLTDMETCYKVMRSEIARELRLEANRFDIEPEITGKLLRAGHRIVECPVRFEPRSRAQGKSQRVERSI